MPPGTVASLIRHTFTFSIFVPVHDNSIYKVITFFFINTTLMNYKAPLHLTNIIYTNEKETEETQDCV